MSEAEFEALHDFGRHVTTAHSAPSMTLAKAFSPALREIRILCSQSGAASAGTRQFIVSKYPIIKKHNPDLPVLIREATGTPARAFARFERGVEKHVELDNLSAVEVETKLGQLLST